nr:L-lactate permease [Bacillus subtilis]
MVLSAVGGVVGIILFFWGVVIKGMKGYRGGLATLGIGVMIGVLVYGMRGEKGVMCGREGGV